MQTLLDARFSIRPALPADVPEIVRILRAQEKLRKGALGGVHYPSLRESIRKGWVHVGVMGDRVVGSVEYYARKDGWRTIYQIAVDPLVAGLGVGRNLLYSVECPIRLKCPQVVSGDLPNPANTFYQNAGMRFAGTDTTRSGKRLNVWDLPILPILVQGTNRRMPEVARRSGWAYGSRATETPRDWCLQIDIEWRDYRWADYLRKIEKWRPFAALVPDYERPEQRRTMLNRIEHLKRLGVMRVLVCPKFPGAVADIPLDCVVAVSIPSSYAGFVPDYQELIGRRVHLLGGTPAKWLGERGRRQQMSATGYISAITGAGARVISVDGNVHTRIAAQAGYWQGGVWVFEKKLRQREFDLYELMVQSGGNIRRALNEPAPSQLHLM